MSRLILSLGKLGNKMAGLPGGPADDEVMADVMAVERTGTPVVGAEKEKEKEKEVPRQAAQQQQQQQGGASGGGGGGGGKGKKKRGKK